MYNHFRANEIKPKGWLKTQLQIQANGLSGNLDKVWPDVRDSAWIGGDKEGWERVPYWLDGFIPLAYLLEDEYLKARADKYINAILNNQQDDGWICPCKIEERSSYDIWALFLIGKVLSLYCEFTDSDRAKEGLYRAMKNGYNLIRDNKIILFEWGKSRWFEAFIPLQFLYNEFKEQWILDFAKELRSQGTDYLQLTELWKNPLNKWSQETHIVNIAMMFKFEAVSCSLLGEKYEGKAEKLWKFLEKYNGTAYGAFTGDECLSGKYNNQGTELCSIVELMYSCEILYAVTGKEIWAERLEKLAFNALPATISDDMWTHQYDQMANQIACVRFPGRSLFRTNNNEAHLFGLEPHYGCCTSNFNQGWPKLAMNVFLKTKKGIKASVMLPAVLETAVDGADVIISAETEYPFRFKCKYKVSVSKPCTFEFKIRIPKWANNVVCDSIGVLENNYISIDKTWAGTEEITVIFEDVPHFVNRPFGLKTVEYGPLVFAIPIDAEYKMYEYLADGVERKFPYCDYELYPKAEWRYGFISKDFAVNHKKGDNCPFSSKNPKTTLLAKCAPVDWTFADGYETVSDIKPKSKKAKGKAVDLELFPYGCAKLRITETVFCNGVDENDL